MTIRIMENFQYQERSEDKRHGAFKLLTGDDHEFKILFVAKLLYNSRTGVKLRDFKTQTQRFSYLWAYPESNTKGCTLGKKKLNQQR